VTQSNYVFKVGDVGLTRGGDYYEVLCVLDEPLDNGDTLVARSGGRVLTYTHNGEYIRSDFSAEDILPPTITVYVNFYHNESRIVYACPYETKEEAEEAARASKQVTRAIAVPVELSA
jgi:hypothetical protein